MEGEILTLELWRDALVVNGAQRIPLDQSKGYAKALEDAVYDNPQLLADFQTVHIVVDTPRYMIVPAEITDPVLQQQMMSVLWPQEDYTVLCDSLTSSDMLLWEVDSAILGFIRRTFAGLEVTHRMSGVITRSIEHDREDNLSRMYAYLRGADMDLVYIRDGRLAVANTYAVNTVSDMMYYIMAAAQASSFSEEYDELMLIGEDSTAQDLKEQLAPYIINIKVCE